MSFLRGVIFICFVNRSPNQTSCCGIAKAVLGTITILMVVIQKIDKLFDEIKNIHLKSKFIFDAVNC